MKKRKLNKKGKFVLFMLLLIVVIIILCLFANKKSESKNTNTIPEKIEIIDLDSNTRPYAVMINNISTVWGYQSGLQDAYIIYEIIVEGGYTRLMALFKDKNLDRIGSVRSSRHYFLDYALENDAIYVHFGWSPQAEKDIKTLGINNINFMSYNGYTRDYSLGLALEHTAFTTTQDIEKGIKKYSYRNTTSEKSLLNYTKSQDLSKIDGSIVANKVDIVYSSSRSTSFEYDSSNKVYKRYQNNKPHIDYLTKEQYTAKNIITYQVDNYTIEGDKSGRQTINNIGSGDGWYISEGYAIPIKWEKSSRQSKTKYKYLNGEEIRVNDGNTYIEIQPSKKDITIE